MAGWFSQDRGSASKDEPTPKPTPTSTLPDPVMLREHTVWTRSGDGPMLRYFCMEVLPSGGFFCVWVEGWKGSAPAIEAWDNVPPHLLYKLNGHPPNLHPTLEEAVAAFNTSTAPMY